MRRIAETYGKHHFPRIQPVFQFIISKENITVPQTADSHFQSDKRHIFRGSPGPPGFLFIIYVFIRHSVI